MAQDLTSLAQDLLYIFRAKESVTLFELATLTEERQPRIKAILDIFMIHNDNIKVDGTTYTFNEKQKTPIVLYSVFAADPINDTFYFNPEEPSPTAAEIAEKKFMAAFRNESEALEYANDYGFQILRIEESIPEENDERLVVI